MIFSAAPRGSRCFVLFGTSFFKWVSVGREPYYFFPGCSTVSSCCLSCLACLVRYSTSSLCFFSSACLLSFSSMHRGGSCKNINFRYRYQ